MRKRAVRMDTPTPMKYFIFIIIFLLADTIDRFCSVVNTFFASFPLRRKKSTFGPMEKVFVLNGPNLNLLGTREPEIYGSATLADILRTLRRYARRRGVRVRSRQSNHEGRLIDTIQRLKARGFSGLIINPGALTHYSYALRDAIKASGVRSVEVHLSDIEKREEFRRVSVIRDVCAAQIKGLGPEGYLRALDALIEGWAAAGGPGGRGPEVPGT
jgi:3-dehydroquinate dehydratase-2